MSLSSSTSGCKYNVEPGYFFLEYFSDIPYALVSFLTLGRIPLAINNIKSREEF